MSRLEPSVSRSEQVYVVVSDRPWNREMAHALHLRTEFNFVLISDVNDLTVANIRQINPKFIFFPHWSHRIDAGIYEEFECVIFHMTDLPFGRGGSPLQNLIVRGVSETKISALRCVEELDGGPIYLKKSLSLHGSAEEIFLRASSIIEEMIVEILATSPQPVSQGAGTTVFRRRRPEDGDVADAKSLEQLFDLIRMLDADGYPHAFLSVGPFKLEFSRASLKTSCVMADVRISLADKVQERDKQ